MSEAFRPCFKSFLKGSLLVEHLRVKVVIIFIFEIGTVLIMVEAELFGRIVFPIDHVSPTIVLVIIFVALGLFQNRC